MKILISAIGVRGGGVETYLLGLLPDLVGFNTSIRYELLIPESREYLYRNLGENLDVKTVPDKIVNSTLHRFYYEHITLNNYIFKNKFDLHFRTDEMLSPFSIFTKVPSLIVFHTTLPIFMANTMDESWIRIKYINTIRRLAIKMAYKVVTVSNHAKAELSGKYPFAFNKINVVYHGVNRKLFYPQKNSFPTDVVGNQRYILTVSDRHYHKRIDHLVEAYAKLVQNKQIEQNLVIIGRERSNEVEERIKKVILDNHLNEKVKLINHIDNNKLPLIYSNADIYMFPSTFETFGLTPIEAMACGIPTGCSNQSVMPEVCGAGALYFDSLDLEDISEKMYQLLKDKKLREELVLAGLKQSDNFSWELAAERYYKIIMEVKRGKNEG
jgi:glycosyltransferase involved in cell wall biosynthesis